MKNLIAKRMKSDKAAAGTVETILIIALAVFAALALITFILTPTQNSAKGLGDGIQKGVNGILTSDGDVTKVDFSGSVIANPGPGK